MLMSLSSTVYVVDIHSRRMRACLQHFRAVQILRRLPLFAGRKHVSKEFTRLAHILAANIY